MQEDALPALDPKAFQEMEDKIRNRIVLLGDTKPESYGLMFLALPARYQESFFLPAEHTQFPASRFTG
jgi:hypothetical protein